MKFGIGIKPPAVWSHHLKYGFLTGFAVRVGSLAVLSHEANFTICRILKAADRRLFKEVAPCSAAEVIDF